MKIKGKLQSCYILERGDYIRDIIDNAVPQVEGYDGTVEYLNKDLNPKTSDAFEIYKFQKTIQDSDRLESIAISTS